MKRLLFAAFSILTCVLGFSQTNSINATGKVGIGTTTPTEALTVVGNVKIDSSLIVNDTLFVAGRATFGDGISSSGRTTFHNGIVIKEQTSTENLKVEGTLNAQGPVKMNLDSLGNVSNPETTHMLFLNEQGVVETADAFGFIDYVGYSLGFMKDSSGNQTFTGDFIVDGTTRLGDLELHIPTIDTSDVDTTTTILLGKGDGFVNKALVFDVLGTIYKGDCKMNLSGDVPNPVWSNGLNKVYLGCGPVRVGIGTSNPSHTLHVTGSSLFGQSLQVDQTVAIGTTPSAFSRLKIGNSSLGAGIEIDQNANVTPFSKLLYMEYTEPTTEIIKVRNTAGNYDAFLLQSDGKMVINNGTDKTFQVNPDGLTLAREVLLDLEDWPDYVFENDYQLMPLSEVEKFIEEKGHLPNIPSAKTMETEGLKVAEMNKLLMQKIEELTLHLIEQDKKIAELQQQIQNKQ